jgi:hypothetical protein
MPQDNKHKDDLMLPSEPNLKEPNKSQLRKEPAYRLKLQLKRLPLNRLKEELGCRPKPRPSDWLDSNKPEKHEFRPKYRLKYKPDNKYKDRLKQNMSKPLKDKPSNKP